MTGHAPPAAPVMEETMLDQLTPSVTEDAGISLTPHTVLGYRADGRPIFPIAGGADDDSEQDTDSGEDTSASDDTSAEVDDSSDDDGEQDTSKPKPSAKTQGEGEEEYTPPSQAEWRRTQAALKKANEDAKRNRFRARELEEKQRENETEHEKAIRVAREEGEKQYRTPLVKAAARAALAEAGVNGSTDRVLRLVDLDGLSVDEDGDVVGLDAEIGRVKEEYPEFFQTARVKPKARPTAANREPAPEKPKSSAERHAAKVLGRTAT